MTAVVDDPAPARPRRWSSTAAALGLLVVAVLMVDAAVTLVLEVLYLPLYMGGMAFPIAALCAGAVNIALVHGASVVSPRPAVMFLPMAVWLLCFLIAAGGGPGGDVPLGSDLPTLLLFLCGVLPPLIYLYVAANRARSAAGPR
ncbi:hypothetical protein [Nocardia paucivorans]|uniref:hypothetical protein n=1 Tax=Nocardia paucivorans TaxID=114259 RepID=UPI0003125C13|nr:hypothetical protein [Nocardia paucivorans]